MLHKPRHIEDQVIVLTGATSGIGLATARLAAARGARLVLAARNTDVLRQLTEELTSGARRPSSSPPTSSDDPGGTPVAGSASSLSPLANDGEADYHVPHAIVEQHNQPLDCRGGYAGFRVVWRRRDAVYRGRRGHRGRIGASRFRMSSRSLQRQGARTIGFLADFGW